MASSQDPRASPSFSWQGNPGEVLGYWGFLAGLPCSRATSDGQPRPHLTHTWAGLADPAMIVELKWQALATPPLQHTHMFFTGWGRALSPVVVHLSHQPMWPRPFMWPLQWMPCFQPPRFGPMTVTPPQGFLPVHKESFREGHGTETLSSHMRWPWRQACGLQWELWAITLVLPKALLAPWADTKTITPCSTRLGLHRDSLLTYLSTSTVTLSQTLLLSMWGGEGAGNQGFSHVECRIQEQQLLTCLSGVYL